jgi:HSP20 family protein
MGRLQNEMNRVFGKGGDGSRSFTRSYPALNIWEDKDKLYVEAELPGFSMEDLEIFIENNLLTIKGERKAPEAEDITWHRQECGFGSFSRTFELPDDVDAEKVEASLRNGILLIELPRREEVKPRRIEVKAD